MVKEIFTIVYRKGIMRTEFKIENQVVWNRKTSILLKFFLNLILLLILIIIITIIIFVIIMGASLGGGGIVDFVCGVGGGFDVFDGEVFCGGGGGGGGGIVCGNCGGVGGCGRYGGGNCGGVSE
jgi:hypothetical protein